MRKLPLVALLALASITPSATASADEEAGPVIASGGDRALQRMRANLPWRTPGKNGEVRFGGELRCDSGCTVRWADGSQAELEPGTIAIVEEPTFVRFDREGRALPSNRIDVRKGAAWIDRPAGVKNPLVVGDGRGPVGAAGAGRARVIAGSEGFAFAAISSPGFVRARGQWAPLAANHAVSARGAAAPSVRKLVASPSWSAPRGPIAASPEAGAIAIAPTGAGAAVGASWQPVAGASSYKVEIAKDAAFGDVVQTATVDASAFRTVLPAGAYFARVRAFDSSGLESAPSAARRMRVVPLSLPAGGLVQGSRMVAPTGSAVRFADVEGLEMAFGKGGFSRAGSMPLVANDDPRAIRLRVQGDPLSETAFSVEARALRADVRMAPALPRWPTDPVDVTIEISDPSGIFDIAEITPSIRVTVGVAEAPVRFTELPSRGSVRILRGRVEPRPGHGPSVVRVEVTDPGGSELGRGFVEVAREAVGRSFSSVTVERPRNSAKR
jgi:hypothetical protein